MQSRGLLDVCDASRHVDAKFDAVVAYGGPFSHAFEDVDEALSGLLRITKPGGAVVASVMSVLGSWRLLLRGALEDTEGAGEELNDLVLATGDRRDIGTAHVWKMFAARDASELVARCAGDVVSMSASHWTSLDDIGALGGLEQDAGRWDRCLDHETAACVEPGSLDGGTCLLFAAGRACR